MGSLLEKDLATPEYYPLSLNALVLACNQKTNREPVTDYSEEQVWETLAALRSRGLVAEVPSSRVTKFEHRLGGQLNLGRGELALLAVLLLRGPQTLYELRERTARMHPFEDTDAVRSTLHRMPAGLVVELPPRPGWREIRWAEQLTGPPPTLATTRPDPEPIGPDDRLRRLEAEFQQLRARLEALERKFGDF